MKEIEATAGLSCPQCGGMVPIPEGQQIVACPYCSLRSAVQGERGVQRFQVAQKISRDQAIAALRTFLGSNLAIARDAGRKASLQEAFVVSLPFWSVWARGLGWVLGQKRVGSGKHSRLEPREVRSVHELNWTGAACDVAEFGVPSISLDGRLLLPFDPDQLHETGMVFEPVGSASVAQSAASQSFSSKVQRAADLTKVSQTFVRMVNRRLALVYYPLWVLRYAYRNRTFQVVVDGFSGEVLYGKAPGSVGYRAGMLVAGMAAGAFVAVDGAALGLWGLANTSGDDEAGFFLAITGGALLLGGGMMYGGYRAFRYGEHYELKRGGKTGESWQETIRMIKEVVE